MGPDERNLMPNKGLSFHRQQGGEQDVKARKSCGRIWVSEREVTQPQVQWREEEESRKEAS